jgi:hypothetical protein
MMMIMISVIDGKPEVKRLLGRQRHRQVNNIKLHNGSGLIGLIIGTSVGLV